MYVDNLFEIYSLVLQKKVSRAGDKRQFRICFVREVGFGLVRDISSLIIACILNNFSYRKPEFLIDETRRRRLGRRAS